MNMCRVFFLVLSLSAITACGLGGGSVPQDHHYRLPELLINAQAETSFDQIVIKPVKATGLYHDRAILYVEEDKPLELKRYHYNFWSETPANLIHGALYQAITDSGISQKVSGEVTQSRADYVIDTRIVNFERVIQGSEVTVQVALDVHVRSGSNSSRFWTKRYSSELQIATTAMYPSAEAFGQAMQVISEQLISDLLVK